MRDHPLPERRLKCYERHSAAEIGAIMRGADGLLLLIGDQHGHRMALSGKLWDYLAAGAPIIGIGPERAAAQSLILDHHLGVWANTDDREGILDIFKTLSRGELSRPQARDQSTFHARQMSASIAELLNHATHHQPTRSSTAHRSSH